MRPTIADVLRLSAQDYLREHALSKEQARAWRALCACRTQAMGGQCLGCKQCGHQHWQYHSCRNRHCPTCGARAKDLWLQGRIARLLDTPYLHMVFALPHELNQRYQQAPKDITEILFASVQQTLNGFLADPKWLGVQGAIGAYTLVLHTWSQDLGLHLHLHAIVACGGFKRDTWHAPAKGAQYLFPTRALSKVWRGKFMSLLQTPQAHGPSPTAKDLSSSLTKRLWSKDWVVYAKAPLGGAAQALQYLSRYTHRTAIGNERLRGFNGEEVVISVRAKRGEGGGGKRIVRLGAHEFIRRFLQHILPRGLKRIRHFGLLANCNGAQFAKARAALNMPAPNPVAQQSAQVFMQQVAQVEITQCPKCTTGVLVVIASCTGLRFLPHPHKQQRSQASCAIQARAPP